MNLDLFSLMTSAGALADWIVTAIFMRAAWSGPRPTWLAERALRSLTLSVAVTLFAFIAIGDLNGLDEQTVRAFGSIAVAVVSLYPLGLLAWYVHWRRHQK